MNVEIGVVSFCTWRGVVPGCLSLMPYLSVGMLFYHNLKSL